MGGVLLYQEFPAAPHPCFVAFSALHACANVVAHAGARAGGAVQRGKCAAGCGDVQCLCGVLRHASYCARGAEAGGWVLGKEIPVM